ncbi:MAG: hypothetical protein IPJ77_19205 [Planctomycetes bacterium]|nr:hypothetical protein [Planctomycetota bacterium]
MNQPDAKHSLGLNAVRHACSQVLRSCRRELLLSALTDRSFEEGVRARDFRESVQSFRDAGLGAAEVVRIEGGLNGMMEDVLRSEPDIRYLMRSPSRGADHTFAIQDQRAVIETKQVYDLTYRTYYHRVIAD